MKPDEKTPKTYYEYANNNCTYTLEQLVETLQEELKMMRIILQSHYICDSDIVTARKLFSKDPSP